MAVDVQLVRGGKPVVAFLNVSTDTNRAQANASTAESQPICRITVSKTVCEMSLSIFPIAVRWDCSQYAINERGEE